MSTQIASLSDAFSTYWGGMTRAHALLLAARSLPHWWEPVANYGDIIDDEGEIELEWWCKDRHVAVHLRARNASFLRSWSMDGVIHVDGGKLSLSDFKSHWLWLIGEEV